MQHHATVVHALPHRTRVRLPRDQRREKLERARAVLSHVGGVLSVDISASSNSLVVHHQDSTSQDELGAAVEDATGLTLDALPPRLRTEFKGEVSGLALSIRDAFTAVDRRVRKATNGWVDLKMMVPIGLIGLAVVRAAEEQEGVASVPPFILIYYAFDSYMKLHRSFAEAEEAVGLEAGGNA